MIKQGDKVICTDVSGFDMSHLTLGQEYVVEWSNGVDIRLTGVVFITKAWRFKLVENNS